MRPAEYMPPGKHGGVAVTGTTTVRHMDLRSWLLDAHADLRGRLFASVISMVPAERWTERADGGGSSIAWLLLHLARHQDLAISTAIRNQPPLFLDHRERLGLAAAPTWAGLTESEHPDQSGAPASDALVAYVDAVFVATAAWLDKLSAMALVSIPNTRHRLEAKALLSPDEVGWLFSMWDAKSVDWFVQWPVLGHGNAHVGEAISVRNRMGLSPF